MPTFSTNPLEGLALQAQDADHTINLGALDVEAALDQVKAALKDHQAGETLCFCFDGPKGDGRPTLFQPLGRFLLDARRTQQLSRCLPLTAGNGYVVTLA